MSKISLFPGFILQAGDRALATNLYAVNVKTKPGWNSASDHVTMVLAPDMDSACRRVAAHILERTGECMPVLPAHYKATHVGSVDHTPEMQIAGVPPISPEEFNGMWQGLNSQTLEPSAIVRPPAEYHSQNNPDCNCLACH